MSSCKMYNVVLEAIGVCCRYYQKKDFIQLNEGLKKRVGYKEETNTILLQLQKVYEEIIDGLVFDEAYKEYFEDYDEFGVDCLASIMFQEAFYLKQVDYKALPQIIKKNPMVLFEEYRAREDERITLSISEIIELLQECGISDQLKWKFIELFTNFEQIVDQLFQVLLPIMKRIDIVYERYQKELYQMHQHWVQAEADGNFFKKIKQVFNISISMEEEYALYSNYMMCNSVRILDSRYHPGINIFYIGALFQSDSFQLEELGKEEMYACLKVLCDPSKYEMLMMLKQQPQYGSQLAKALHLSPATISHHVNALLLTGIIDVEKDSNRVYYKLNQEQIQKIMMTLQKDFLE